MIRIQTTLKATPKSAPKPPAACCALTVAASPHLHRKFQMPTPRWNDEASTSTYANVAEDMRNPWYLAFFVVGVLASSFHLGVGIWNFLCKWGLAATAKSACRLLRLDGVR